MYEMLIFYKGSSCCSNGTEKRSIDLYRNETNNSYIYSIMMGVDESDVSTAVLQNMWKYSTVNVQYNMWTFV